MDTTYGNGKRSNASGFLIGSVFAIVIAIFLTAAWQFIIAPALAAQQQAALAARWPGLDNEGISVMQKAATGTSAAILSSVFKGCPKRASQSYIAGSFGLRLTGLDIFRKMAEEARTALGGCFKISPGLYSQLIDDILTGITKYWTDNVQTLPLGQVVKIFESLAELIIP